MARGEQSTPEPEPRRRYRAKSLEGRERQLTSLVYDVVEERVRSGQATSQELIHFLKAGSGREQRERMKIDYENKLLQAKKEALDAAARSEEMFSNAIAAFGRYSGQTPVNEE